MVLGLGGCDISLAQAAGLHDLDNCAILGESCRGSEVAARAVR